MKAYVIGFDSPQGPRTPAEITELLETCDLCIDVRAIGRPPDVGATIPGVGRVVGHERGGKVLLVEPERN